VSEEIQLHGRPLDELLAVARAEAKQRRLNLKAGEIRIGMWRSWSDLLSGE